jgi:PilZ domain
MSVNKRVRIRRTLKLRALLVRYDQKPSQACTLLDISETGARIALQDVSDLPQHFWIELTERGVPKRYCRLVWKGDTDIGVCFEPENSQVEKRTLQPGTSREEAVSAFGLQS